jgi:hypothetical protein
VLQLRARVVLLRCWLCQGLHWLSSAFLKQREDSFVDRWLLFLCY